MNPVKVALIILDGWGYTKQTLGNAIRMASTPTMDMLIQNYPSLLLQASGSAVGLVWHEPGNSEVGHLTIGAGRVVSQYAPRITKSIENGSFFENPALVEAMMHVKNKSSTLHLIGLLGSGTVHSDFGHLEALLSMAKLRDIKELKIHLFTDGKDSGLKESISLVGKLNTKLEEFGIGQIASIVGRQYAMDRTSNWQFTQKAYNLWVSGRGEICDNPLQAIISQHNEGRNDGELDPMLFDADAHVKDGDAIIFFNFREDSMRQTVLAFSDPNFSNFPVSKFNNLFLTFMTQYLDLPHTSYRVAFPPTEVNNGLSEILSQNGKKQLHIAETEKYAHVTYFFNCLRNNAYEGENDIILDSYSDHSLHPEMRAHDIAEAFMRELNLGLYDFFVINLANADILAHRGDLNLAIGGITELDSALAKIYNTAMENGLTLLVTSDHGNAESMIYKSSGDAETRHNLNPVPLYLIGQDWYRPRTEQEILKRHEKISGIISDIAPTILELMGVEKPAEMSGESLLPLLK